MKKKHSTFKMALIAILCTAAGLISAQTIITDIAGFKAIENQSGEYVLGQALDFLGSDFTGIANFSGTLDGNGYSLKNITINKSNGEVGIFSKTNGATIKNLVVIDANVNVSGYNNQVGILVGQMRGGVIDQCAIIGGSVNGHEHIGSVVGNIGASAVVRNCYSTAIVNGSAWVGGIVGLTDRSGTNIIEKCYNAGVVTNRSNGSGGIVGRAEANSSAKPQVQNNVNLASKIDGNNDRHRVVGVKENDAVLSNNYSLSSTLISNNTVSSEDANSQHGKDITANQARTQSFYTGLGWDFTESTGVWKIDEGNAYPTLQMEREQLLILVNHTGLHFKSGSSLSLAGIERADGNTTAITFSSDDTNINITGTTVSYTGTVSTPQNIEIKAISGGLETTFDILVLPSIIEIANPSALSLISQYPMADFELTVNIDMTGVAFSGLCSNTDPFTGTFDGKGYLISGLTFDNQSISGVGFFKKISGATIQNLGLNNANFVGNEDVGAIAGYATNGSVIKQCFVSNSTVNGRDRAGSMVGKLDQNSIVRDCYAVATTIIGREHQAGGLVGATADNGGAILNSYFEGTVTGTYNRACGILGLMDRNSANNKVENCVNLSSTLSRTDGTNNVYRIADSNGNGSLTNNYSLSSTLVSGATILNTDGEYGTGKKHGADISANDEKTENFYTGLGWNFTDIWTFTSASEYPQLKVFIADVSTATDKTEQSKYQIFTSKNTVRISNLPENALVSIYNIEGRKISKEKASGEYTSQLPSKGFYIVDIQAAGEKSVITKVICR